MYNKTRRKGVFKIVTKSYIELVEKAVAIAKTNKPDYIDIANEITETLYLTMNKTQQKIIGINNRIKTEQSLKEKLIRKRIYKLTSSPEEMIDYIGDVIGILIECEFVKNEESIYNAIFSDFTKYNDVFAQSNINPKIFLDISEKQPQLLKNGTTTYKIDGIYKAENKTYKFELQIKSMVKVFWSEVEHSIVYKNNYYMPDDTYVVNTLEAIKRNLFGLDNMLDLINTHTSTINSSSLISNLTLNEKLVKQLISETFNDKIMRAIRIKINIKNVRDLACKFIMREYEKLPPEAQNERFYLLIERFKQIQKRETLDYVPDEKIIFNNDKYASSQSCLFEMIQSDFEWDLYFQILKSVLPEHNLEYLITETIELLISLLNINLLPIKEQNQELITYIKKGISK